MQPGVTDCKRGKTYNWCLTREKMQPVISAGKLVTKDGETSYAKSGLELLLLVSDLKFTSSSVICYSVCTDFVNLLQALSTLIRKRPEY